MARAWDNWERLVAAVLDKEELRRLAFCPSFSSTSSSADLSWPSGFDFSIRDFFVPYSGVTTEPQRTLASQPSSNVNQSVLVKTFTFREMAFATKKFDRKLLIYEDGSGKVYKGQMKGSKHVVAIKDTNPGNGEFLVEILMLSLVHHPNLVNLIGYSAYADCKILVHEYYPLGSLYYRLHKPISREKPLDWHTRMKIAAGVSKGLEHLHHKANPPIVHCNLTPSSILLDEGHNPKIANFGFSKFGAVGDKSHVSTRIMGTIGYLAPEYAMTGQLTLKADVYSFGVLLLVLISGRKAVEVLENGAARNIVEWARPLFRDRTKFVQMVDPTLRGQYAMTALYQLLAVASMCVREQAERRPLMADVAIFMTRLSSQKYEGNTVKIKSKHLMEV